MTFTLEEAADAILRLGKRVAAAGLVVGAGGNVSVRTGPDEIMVTPSGQALDEIDRADLVILGLDGAVRPGRSVAAGGGGRSGGAGSSRGTLPSSESLMHLAAHRARPDTPVALHVHPPHANLLAAMCRPIRLITLDHAYYVRRLAQVPYLPSGTAELAAAVAEGLSEVDVVMLTHHGCLVVASDAETAYERAVNLEAAATATYRALLLGDVTTVCPPAYLARVEAQEAGIADAGAGEDA
ncbi:MAG: class II aldolase/adducin family protein [Acidimicrobiales bacterium]